MAKQWINVAGAREHNLKDVHVKIPRDELTVVTGLSGSGKSSLAFDTIYAEGQRKYVESLSAYARQFLGQMQKPDVDYIEGLSPAVSIEQRTAGSNPRSIVATTTEIYDYLRLLFASIGKPHCYKCGKPVTSQSAEEIVEQLMQLPAKTKLMILAPYVRGRKGEHVEVYETMRKQGFVRARVDGETYEIEKVPKLKKTFKHTIEAVVDRLAIKDDIRSRMTDSVELALGEADGLVTVLIAKEDGSWEEKMFSEHNACLDCGISFDKLEARHFSFNSPYGACPTCHGLGTQMVFDEDQVIPDKTMAVESCVHPWRYGGRRMIVYHKKLLQAVAAKNGIDPATPFNELPKKVQQQILHGTGDEPIEYYMRRRLISKPFPGVFNMLMDRVENNESEAMSHWLRGYMTRCICPDCNGARLRPAVLACRMNGRNIREIISDSVIDSQRFFQSLELTKQEELITREILKEIRARLSFMVNVGLDYLNLDRESGTLSGGEAQRIRLATQIGAGLVGVVYVLDEPSIGLHQKDNDRLIQTLQGLRDLGNTVIVVEHDEQTIRTADFVVDMGPAAGRHGGEVVFAGRTDKLMKADTLTAKYLREELKVEIPEKRTKPYKGWIELKGAEANNLKKVNAKFPLGLFTCVTGVSGSGKSTLTDYTLKRALARHFNGSKDTPGKHKEVKGLELVDKMIVIDQSPIGRTPRSNPATYTGAFTDIRDLFATLPASKMRGYKPGRFSFNVKGGRCERCKGDGILKIEMHFLPDVYVPCEQCNEKRYNKETLEVHYKGKSIADVLDMTISEALDFFEAVPKIQRKMKTLCDVGLGYLKLGQPATTLSGGEAQRVKLSTELSKRSTGQTVYILDEPTTGLHFADVHKLLEVLERLRDEGNTVIVIEHNLDMIKRADYIVDMGPGGGVNGGKVVVSGPPEKIAKCEGSFTGQYLKELL
ncbi:excinuclease ABC subunit UvrA [Pontiella agarivorans]|uniref:UvrABC system protein A n=1 Tax=Pontiella agarivorans TaxID=3038953 RepID=A0ABU5N023_9BACT|nr:excinuclease ABC subunit UvrA [Pontiella agarivorans]MDZ8119561.1 excinuclease ABC subunit UvrA [Pontiella agarivorans]